MSEQPLVAKPEREKGWTERSAARLPWLVVRVSDGALLSGHRRHADAVRMARLVGAVVKARGEAI